MILIVGASSGLGFSLANRFKNTGKIFLVSRKKIKIKNPNFVKINIDINGNNLNKLFNKIKKKKLRYIFFTVGYADWNNDNLNINKENAEKIIRTNFLSITNITNELIRRKKMDKNCLICFCSSVSTILPRHRQIFYCSSKSALNSYAKSLEFTNKLDNLNFQVVNLMLGYIETKMNKNISTPLKKMSPNYVADFIYKNRKNLNGTIFLPRYWVIIKMLIALIPKNLLVGLIKVIFSKRKFF